MVYETVQILLVEDDEVDVMNIKRAFKKCKITNPLFVAGNGLKALEMLRGNNADPPVVPTHNRLILLDINMPKMNGIEFLKELRSDPKLKFIPVIVLTTSDEDQDKIEAYNFNVAGYIIKPVTFSNFTATIATLTEYWNLSEMI